MVVVAGLPSLPCPRGVEAGSVRPHRSARPDRLWGTHRQGRRGGGAWLGGTASQRCAGPSESP